MIAIDRRFLEGSVHPLDLTIRPRVVGFDQVVFDTVGSADLVEAVDPITSRPAIAIFRCGENNAPSKPGSKHLSA